MTKQEIFDKVSKHLLTQNGKSLGERNCGSKGMTYGCMYRSPEGLKCAVGCLITDEHYSPDLEGRLMGRPTVILALMDSGVDGIGFLGSENERLLHELQTIHDRRDVPQWAEELERVAHLHNLTWENPLTTKQGEV